MSSSTRSVRHEALAQFLKSRREHLSLESCGLPSARGRKRTPGLRREDVSAIAGISTAYYTWIEQGRTFDISAEVLHAIAGALRLNEVETSHIFTLAGKAEPAPAITTQVSGAGPEWNRAIFDIVGLDLATPALLLTPWLEVIDRNAAARDLLEVDPGVNVIYRFFCGPPLGVRCVNRPEIAAALVALLRRNHARDMDNGQFSVLIERLREDEVFCTQWERQSVDCPAFFDLEVEHRRLGYRALRSVVLRDPVVSSQYVMLMRPLATSPP